MSCQHAVSHTNFSTNQTHHVVKLSSQDYLNVSLHGIVSTIGIMENLLILGIVGFRVRRSIISVWILNLAASDLLATAFLPFFTLYMARGKTWTLGPTFCRIYSSIFFLNMFVSAFLLAAISLDRCLVVVKPVWTQNHRSIQVVRNVCWVIWACAVVCTIPFYMFRDAIPRGPGKVFCYYNYARFLPEEPYDLKALCTQRKEGLAFMKLLLGFLIPLTIIVISYVTVSQSLARRGSRRPFRFVRLVVTVVVVFVLCWAPYHLFIILEVLAPEGSPTQKLASGALPTAATIGYLNSTINPILYVFSCPDLCNKIRQSLGAVMESVLAEDLGELSRRRSTGRSSLSNSEFMIRKKSCSTALVPKPEERDQTEVFSL